VQRQVGPATEHLGLGQAGVREDDPEPAAHRAVEHVLQREEESRAAVGERVRLERAEGQGPDVPEPAPDGRLGREEQVTTGQVNRPVVGPGPGHPGLAGEAPVVVINLRDRLVEDRQGHETRPRRAHRSQVGTENGKLDVLPPQAEPDVDREHPREVAEQVDTEDRTVHPAADEDRRIGAAAWFVREGGHVGDRRNP